MSNHITIEFCKEDRQRIDELIGLAGWITGALKDLAAAQPAEPAAAHPVDAVVPFSMAQADDGTVMLVKNDQPADEANYTKDDIQALVMKLAAPGTGKKEAVKAIVNEYAPRISGIPEDKINEVMAKLNQLAEEE